MSETKTAEREKVGAGQRIEADEAPLPVHYDPAAAFTEGADPLYDRVSPRMIAVLKAKWRGLNDGEVAQALELALSVGLNPWTNEVYAGKGQSRDGDGGNLLIMVGRDGLLRKAEEFPDYLGYDAGVVWEGDHFSKGDPNPDAKTMRGRAGVSHTQGLPPSGLDATPIGAWAVAERKGRPPRYFFARWEEYAPDPRSKKPWNKNRAVMMEKVPVSVVHRTLINLSGVYLEEEVQGVLEGTADVVAPTDGGDLPWGMDDLGTALSETWERIRELCTADVYPRAKMEMLLHGIEDGQRTRLLEEMREVVRHAEERAAPSPATAAEEEPADAVVVDEEHPDESTPEDDAAAEEEAQVNAGGEREDPGPTALGPDGEREKAEKATAAETPPDLDALREELEELRGTLQAAEADSDFPEDPDALRREIARIEAVIEAGEDPDQGRLV